MVWQDIVIFTANLLFTFSIFIQVAHGFKEKKAFLRKDTSLINSIGLSVMAVTFFTLELAFSMVIVGINSILWFTLFLQGVLYKKH